VFISLQDLELRSVRFDVDVPAGEIDFDGKTTQVSGLRAQGVAELLSHSLDEIRVQGDLGVTVEAACDRCLDPVRFPLEKHFDLVYVPVGEAVAGEHEVAQSALEVGYYEGGGLSVNDVLREVVLLALPMQLVCEEACKGICPVCGQNRNQRDCGCRTQPVDDRWNKLKLLRAEVGPNN
jgi:uncharacterized protein